MSETSIVRGRIEVQGTIHNGVALNTIVTYYGHEEDWEFKQFVSQEQLDAFAASECLIISKKEQE
jgi:hypothetical protein